MPPETGTEKSSKATHTHTLCNETRLCRLSQLPSSGRDALIRGARHSAVAVGGRSLRRLLGCSAATSTRGIAYNIFIVCRCACTEGRYREKEREAQRSKSQTKTVSPKDSCHCSSVHKKSSSETRIEREIQWKETLKKVIRTKGPRLSKRCLAVGV